MESEKAGCRQLSAASSKSEAPLYVDKALLLINSAMLRSCDVEHRDNSTWQLSHADIMVGW